MLFLDDQKLIVTPELDGGDCLAQESRYFIITYFLQKAFPEDFNSVINLLQVQDGVFVRYNKSPYNDPKDVSRDQIIPLIIALGLFGRVDILWLLFKKQINNFFRFPNGDIGFFQELNVYLRAGRFWLGYPLFFIGDIQLLINSLIICFWVTKRANKFFQYLDDKFGFWWLTCNAPPNKDGIKQEVRGPTCTSNDINHTMILLQARKLCPTLFSWLAHYIYRKYRINGVQWAWTSYYENNNRFDQLISPILEEYFNENNG